MKKPSLENLSEEQLKYVEYLESTINGASNLKQALSRMKNLLADELDKVSNGEPVLILTGDDKLFERVNLMVKNEKDWTVSDIVEIEETTKVTKKKTNIQDYVVKK